MRHTRFGAAVLLAALTAAGALAACSEDDSAGPEVGADVEDIAELGVDDAGSSDLLTYAGLTVTVSGRVGDVVTPGVIRVGGVEGEEGVLVFSAPADTFEEAETDVEALAAEETLVLATGTVRQFLVEPFEQEYGIDLPDDLLDAAEGENVIVAGDVSPMAGQEVAMAGVVEESPTDGAFAVRGAGWTVDVLAPEAGADVAEGDNVLVRGEIVSRSRERLEEAAGRELPSDLVDGLEGDVVLVARDVAVL